MRLPVWRHKAIDALQTSATHLRGDILCTGDIMSAKEYRLLARLVRAALISRRPAAGKCSQTAHRGSCRQSHRHSPRRDGAAAVWRRPLCQQPLKNQHLPSVEHESHLHKLWWARVADWHCSDVTASSISKATAVVLSPARNLPAGLASTFFCLSVEQKRQRAAPTWSTQSHMKPPCVDGSRSKQSQYSFKVACRKAPDSRQPSQIQQIQSRDAGCCSTSVSKLACTDYLDCLSLFHSFKLQRRIEYHLCCCPWSAHTRIECRADARWKEPLQRMPRSGTRAHTWGR